MGFYSIYVLELEKISYLNKFIVKKINLRKISNNKEYCKTKEKCVLL